MAASRSGGEALTAGLAALVTGAFIPFWPDGALAPRWIILSVAVPALFFMVQRVVWNTATISLGLFVFVAGVSLAWSPSIWDGLYLFWHLILFMCLFLLAFSLQFNIESVCIGAGMALLVNSAVTLFQLAGFDWWPGTTAASGLFLNKNMGAEAAVLVVVRLAVIGGGFWVLAAGATVPFVTFPIARGAVLGASAALLTAIWGYSRFVGLLLLMILASCAFWLTMMAEKVQSVYDRLVLWVDAGKNLTLRGHGLGSFTAIYPYFEHAHNDLLQIAYELGITGVVLILIFFGYCFCCARRPERLVLTAFFVEGLFGFPFYMPVTLAIVALAAGVAVRDRVPVRIPLRAFQPRDHTSEGVDGSAADLARLRAREPTFPF